MKHSIELSSRYGMRTDDFSSLMTIRVREILLVASLYDAFILEEDGQLTELIFEEYRNLDLNLRFAPRFTHVPNAAEALRIVKERSFDLVVTTPRLPDSDIDSFVADLKSSHPDLPVGLLAAHAWDLPGIEDIKGTGEIDWVFLWQGNVRALLAMIKQVEDRRNADHDILEGGVQAIILVEDEVRFYSAYLPHIYTEVTQQTSRLMAEGLNLSHRLLRIRARPKILLAQNYEEAFELYTRFAGNILGVISDLGFPREGRLDPRAGLRLIDEIRKQNDDIPILLQSMEEESRTEVVERGASFVSKASPTLLDKLRSYILDNFGFGDFVFKLPDGTVIDRASDMRELRRKLAEVPEESILFHASRNHFSAWLKARTEFELASLLRPRKASEFPSGEELRAYLTDTLTDYLRSIQSHVIADFDESSFDRFVAFSKIGSGSLGGKGRGLAFMHKLLASGEIDVPGVVVAIPQTVVLASDLFEEFLEHNELRDSPQKCGTLSDEEVLDSFRRARFQHSVRSQLASFLETVHSPLAVRSSSILEDSVYQPFAGVYATIMLPNNHPSLDIRLAQLLEAIKVVYASTYFRAAYDYLESTPFRIEEERMAVLVQRLVGQQVGDLYYPSFSGSASSYNFYPFDRMQPTDGVAQVALGLGKSVVEGFEALRFCPRYPHILPQFSAVKDVLRNAQRRFYALDMSRNDVIPGMNTDSNLAHLETQQAVRDGVALPLVSTYVRSDDRIVGGYSEAGAPLITFQSLLRGRLLPMPEVLTQVLEVCERGIASPVEVEFAANLRPGLGHRQYFNVVQLRPMVVEKLEVDVEVDESVMKRAVVRSNMALGHGRRESFFDLVVVDPRHFDRSQTARVASIIEHINRELRRDKRQFILIGPGRWGSQDPWLGIPVAWSQISGVRAIVETDFPDLQVEPSLGSHFFHNLTCFGVAFFAVHDLSTDGQVNWSWIDAQPSVREELAGSIRHIRLQAAVEVLVDGARGYGAILSTSSTV